MKHLSFEKWCIENNREDLLAEWDIQKNAAYGFFPDKVGCMSSKRRVFWICPSGHSYDMFIGNKTRRNDKCPYCSNKRLLVGFNDLAHVAPSICEEWDYEKNIDLHNIEVSNGINNPHPAYPTELLFGSATKVYWRCKEGHEFYLSPNGRRVKSDGSYAKCDKCANIARSIQKRQTRARTNNLAELVPQAVVEWQYSEHGLSPAEVSCNSVELVHWKCKKGHEFDKRVVDRVGLKGGKYILHQCSECSKYRRTSIAEQICYFYIKTVFPDAINTYKVDTYELDVYIPSIKTGIEYDGAYAHRNRLQRENDKDQYIAAQGIQLFRFRPEGLPDTVSARRITITEDTNGILNGLIILFKCLNADSPPMNIERDYDRIMELFQDRTGHSIASTPYIEEWDYAKNTIDPKYILSTESHIQVWWKCPNGHPSYLSCPYNRTIRHTRCPKCSNLKAARKQRKRVINIETGEVFETISEAEAKYGKVGNTSISCCCRGRYKTAYGYHWKYFEQE